MFKLILVEIYNIFIKISLAMSAKIITSVMYTIKKHDLEPFRRRPIFPGRDRFL